jgi:hypothetical protein
MRIVCRQASRVRHDEVEADCRAGSRAEMQRVKRKFDPAAELPRFYRCVISQRLGSI